MVRLIIFFVFLFLLWVLFASGMPRKRKIIISVIAVLACALAVWIDGYDKREHSNLLSSSEIVSCGVSAEHSYRTNFDVQLCFKNTSTKGNLSRIHMAVIASDCSTECTEVERVERDIPLNIAAGEQTTITQNLAFEALDPTAENTKWSVEILATKARRGQ